MKLGTAAHRIVLEEYLQTIDAGEERIARLERHMEDLLEMWERKAEVAATMGLRGFQTCGAMIIASELGDLRRFEHPRSLMGFLGLVSGEYSTGSRRRQGSITKCGNSHARWMLIEAAWTYRQAPKVSRYLTQRQEGLPREVKELSWRAQNRLSHKYRKLRALVADDKPARPLETIFVVDGHPSHRAKMVVAYVASCRGNLSYTFCRPMRPI